ncbi:NTP transferase domain-containing protein, partial [Candidatus Kuenenbacteria bacterium]|nr:NTP transferase domain-containing protein [Candidatus Kuenenbacteria bacterium]
MSSSRLPGKSMIDIAGKPMIQHVIERLKKAKSIDQIILATSNQSSDEPLADFVRSLGYQVYQHTGDINDVVGRVLAAAKMVNA